MRHVRVYASQDRTRRCQADLEAARQARQARIAERQADLEARIARGDIIPGRNVVRSTATS